MTCPTSGYRSSSGATGAARRLTLLAALLGAALAAVLVPAAPASAHASFVQASPDPGSGLAQAPGEVVIRFTEPLVRDLSKIEVVDRSGEDVTRGPTLPVEGDPQAMRRPLELLSPGGYEVRWTTVSPLDGHTLKGRYTFAVGTSASPSDTIDEGPVDSEGWLGLTGRFAALAGLTLWAGHVLTARVARRVGISDRFLAVVGRGAPALAAVGTAASLASTALVASGSLGALEAVALGSRSGRWRVVLVVAAGVAALLPQRRARPLHDVAAGIPAGIPVGLYAGMSAGLATVALVAEASSGHASSSPAPALAIPSFAVHLAAVGVWVLSVVAAVASGQRLRSALAAFTPWAVGAALVVGVTGVANAVVELEDLGDLTGTGYGNAVLAKGGLFVAVAVFGLLHWLGRRRPDLDLQVLRLPVRGELVALASALAVATALVGFPNPPADAAARERATRADPLLEALEEREAVSLVAAHGRFTVALTLLPPAPGAVDARVQLLGTEAADAVRSGELRGTGPGGEAPRVSLEPCPASFGCYEGRIEVASEGDWRFDVSFETSGDPIEASYELPLPAPDGSEVFEAMREAMRNLESLRVQEDLSDRTDGAVVASTYTFRAPDRMRWAVDGGSTKVAIGETGYSRTSEGEPWSEYEWPDPGFAWPEGFYDSFFARSTAHRLLGRDTVDGVETRVLSFVQPTFKAWYRVWVGVDDGLIRRLEMRAERHIMDHTYGSFDEPVSIRAPL